MIENTQIKYRSKKYTMQKYNKMKLPGSVPFYDTQPGNEVGLFYNSPEPMFVIVKLSLDSQYSSTL